jgi:hypothetical protein
MEALMQQSNETAPGAGEAVAELRRTLELMCERDRIGVSVTELIARARKLAGAIPIGLVPTGVVAGYLMKGNPRVFYPADYRPTDINNFTTLVYAQGDAPEHEQYYVLRYVDRVDGPLGQTHALVSVSDWNAGMSRAVSERVCDSQGIPLVVFKTAPVGPKDAGAPDAPKESPCS